MTAVTAAGATTAHLSKQISKIVDVFVYLLGSLLGKLLPFLTFGILYTLLVQLYGTMSSLGISQCDLSFAV
jgi:hypothetical protein